MLMNKVFRKLFRRLKKRSNAGMNSTTAVYRDTLSTAIIKNLITVGLSVSIIYINSSLVHTFTKHEVCILFIPDINFGSIQYVWDVCRTSYNVIYFMCILMR